MASAGSPHPLKDLHDGKTEAIAQIIKRSLSKPLTRILVVGCGSGLEAAILAQELGAATTGIDLSADFDPVAASRATLVRGDATMLEFPDQSFDLVFSYHALEHIPQYAMALSEIRRVLAEDGHWCVGTPNRLRLIGYLGSKDASLRQKLAWNAADWSARFRGRFRNEYGAHAGFSSEELHTALGRVFSVVHDVTFQYYMEVYASRVRFIQWIHASGIGRFVFPSVYFIGSK